MRVRDEVSSEKLRGGFYSPVSLVQVCVDRLEDLLGTREGLDVLEPAVGDGAFIRGLAATRFLRRVRSITAIELLEPEAAKAREALAAAAAPGKVIEGDFVGWSLRAARRYHAALGNPPFVRFQFVPGAMRHAAIELGQQLGLVFRGVSNLWLPVFVGAVSLLRPGGAFAFIVPAESFTGVSAGVGRDWLLRNVERLRADLFPPGSFPGVLQEVIVLSGVRRLDAVEVTSLSIHEHVGRSPSGVSWRHALHASAAPWTRFLLRPSQLQSLEAASELRGITELHHLARFEVAAVTGANDFFSADASTVSKYGLDTWTRPLLPRIRHAPGLRYTAEDHEAALVAGARTALLDFAEPLPNPLHAEGPAQYIRLGVDGGLAKRYKTRIRQPWYRVPGIRPGQLMLSKRSHWYPRLVFNELGAVTTDTIYRGRMLATSPVQAENLIASFHNSLTLLTAEVEGRSFGGGVLELVPSEIARLIVPLLPAAADQLGRLDLVSRAGKPEELVEATDELLLASLDGVSRDLLYDWNEARRMLQARRLDRAAQSARLVPVSGMPEYVAEEAEEQEQLNLVLA